MASLASNSWNTNDHRALLDEGCLEITHSVREPRAALDPVRC